MREKLRFYVSSHSLKEEMEKLRKGIKGDDKVMLGIPINLLKDAEVVEMSEDKKFRDGVYTFKVLDVEKNWHFKDDDRPACYKARLKLRIYDQGFYYDLVQEIYLLSSETKLIYDFFVSVGYIKRGESFKLAWEKAIGRSGLCVLGYKEGVAKSGDPISIRYVKKFLDPIKTKDKEEVE